MAVVLAIAVAFLYAGSDASAAARPGKAKWGKCSSTSSSITLRWHKVRGAGGYSIFYKTKSGRHFYQLTGTSRTVYKWCDEEDVKADTSYQFYIRAYKKLGVKSTYGKKSAVRTVMTKSSGSNDSGGTGGDSGGSGGSAAKVSVRRSIDGVTGKPVIYVEDNKGAPSFALKEGTDYTLSGASDTAYKAAAAGIGKYKGYTWDVTDYSAGVQATYRDYDKYMASHTGTAKEEMAYTIKYLGSIYTYRRENKYPEVSANGPRLLATRTTDPYGGCEDYAGAFYLLWNHHTNAPADNTNVFIVNGVWGSNNENSHEYNVAKAGTTWYVVDASSWYTMSFDNLLAQVSQYNAGLFYHLSDFSPVKMVAGATLTNSGTAQLPFYGSITSTGIFGYVYCPACGAYHEIPYTFDLADPADQFSISDTSVLKEIRKNKSDETITFVCGKSGTVSVSATLRNEGTPNRTEVPCGNISLGNTWSTTYNITVKQQ